MGAAAIPMAIGAAAMLGGSVLKSQQQNKFAAAQSNALLTALRRRQAAQQAERDRQKALRVQAEAQHADVLNNLTREVFDENKDATATEFTDRTVTAAGLDQPVSTKFLSGQDTPSASNVVKNQVAQRLADKAAVTRGMIAALAKEQGYKRANEKAGTKLARGDEAISTVNNMRRGSLAVGRIEADAAGTPKTVAPPNTTFADLLIAGGQFGMGAAGNMGGVFGGAPSASGAFPLFPGIPGGPVL